MPNAGTVAQRLREEGIQKVDSFLTSTCNAKRLPTEVVQAHTRRSMIDGWTFEVETGLSIRRLDVLLDNDFPFSVPHFFRVDPPEILTWPHIEKDGFLCLLSGSKAAKPQYPAEIVAELLGDAYHLICASESGENEADFRTEFHSYWDRSLSDKSEKILSLLKPGSKSRFVQIWRGKTRPVIGESESDILSWLRNRHGEEPQFDSTHTALLLFLPQALLPSQYPQSAADVHRLALTTEHGKSLIERFAKIGKSPFYFLLAADSGNGPCLAGVKTFLPPTLDNQGRRRNRSSHGFRTGKVPTALVAHRLFSMSSKARRMNVERVDSAWIHGRGKDKHHDTLSKKKILIIGCGSVGGPIAQYLAMGGVGSLHLVDPESLSWANVGRHPLGAEHVDKSKAIKLAEKLQLSYPHAQITGYESSYEAFIAEHHALLQETDLIISATAEWETESLMNLQHVNREIACPILYTWTEPYACAGHAVSISAGAPCLQCGMTSKGGLRNPVTSWKEEAQSHSEPACGAFFQPYGPIEGQGTISVAASLALDTLLGKTKNAASHRVWAGPQSLLAEAGGDWSEIWRNGHPEREQGGLQTDLAWERDDLCSVCNVNATGAQSHSESEIQTNAWSSIPPCSTI